MARTNIGAAELFPGSIDFEPSDAVMIAGIIEDEQKSEVAWIQRMNVNPSEFSTPEALAEFYRKIREITCYTIAVRVAHLLRWSAVQEEQIFEVITEVARDAEKIPHALLIALGSTHAPQQ